MNNIIALDTSAIIWDINDFEKNKYHYYHLAIELSNLFEEIQKVNFNILLRSELQNEMIDGFLFSKLPKEYYYVGRTFYSFFDRVVNKLVSYPNNTIPHLTSIPNQVKNHFNQSTKNEIEYLLSEIHSNTGGVSYFTFKYLWINNDNLKTVVSYVEKTYNTIISDKNNELQLFIDSIIPRFEHNSKHNCTDYNSKEQWLALQTHERSSFVSQLSCYCEQNVDKAQALLNKRYSILIDNCYYSYDNENEVYVVFRKTRNNIFHAYDEYDINRIPQEVKEHFNIWKYRWHH